MDNVIDRLYRGIRFILDHIIGNIAVLAMFLGTGLAILEVFRRYVFGVVYDWGQDAVTYGIVASVFLYFAVTQARRSHLRVSFVIEALEARGMKRLVLAIRAMISAMSLTLFSALCYWGLPAVERSMMMERTTQSMVLVIWPFQLALLVTFGLMALVTAFQLYQDVRALFDKKVFEWAPVDEGIDI
ncbi:MAG: TRAP transporter small permease [Pseudomonadota bacterium]